MGDAYPHPDLVTYPSTGQGFGKALLEAIYFKRLVVINRYPVYNADIGPFRESAGPWANLFSPETPPANVARVIIEALKLDRAFQLRRRILTHFTWKKIIKTRVLPLLAEVVDQADQCPPPPVNGGKRGS